MNKIVLIGFAIIFVSHVLAEDKGCQKDTDCSSGECCGTGFRGEHICTKIRAKGEICWHYGTRDYPTCPQLSHNCANGWTCLPKNDPQDANAYVCK